MLLQIGRRLYHDKSTGEIIVDTGERAGWVIETTVEQDIEAYTSLSERNPDTVGMVHLEYGQYAEDFAICNGYRINPVTKDLEFSYPDPTDPEPPVEPVYKKPLSEEVEGLKAADLDNKEAIATLYEMMLGGMV